MRRSLSKISRSVIRQPKSSIPCFSFDASRNRDFFSNALVELQTLGKQDFVLHVSHPRMELKILAHHCARFASSWYTKEEITHMNNPTPKHGIKSSPEKDSYSNPSAQPHNKYSYKFHDKNVVTKSNLHEVVEHLELESRSLLETIKSLKRRNQKKVGQPMLAFITRKQILTNIHSWSTLWGKSNVHGAHVLRGAKRCSELLDAVLEDDIQNLQYLSNKSAGIANACTQVIVGWSKSGSTEAAKNSLSILNRLELLYEQGNEAYRPNLFTYNSVLSALSSTLSSINKSLRGQPPKSVFESNIPTEMERIIERMEENYAHGRNVISKPNNMSYNMLITAYSRCNIITDPGERAQRVLEKMVKLYQSDPVGRERVKPDVFTYASLSNALCKSGTSDGISRAESVLRKMEECYKKEKDVSLKPNVIAMGTVLIAWCRLCEKHKGKGEMSKIAMERALWYLDWMTQSYLEGNKEMKPSTYLFNSVLKNLPTCTFDHLSDDSGILKAEELLGRLEELYQSGSGIEPDVYSYTTIISAWAQSKSRDAVYRAESFLDRMERLYVEGVNSARPNTATYNAVISAYSRMHHSDAIPKAEKLLRRMERLEAEGNLHVSPDKITYSSVMAAVMKNGEKGHIGTLVENLHQEMELRFRQTGDIGCRPDTVSFSTIISALAKDNIPDAPYRAEAIISRMKAFGDKSLSPNRWTYNHLILCWVNSAEVNAMERVEDIVRFMAKQYELGDKKMRPDMFTYSHLLHGWSMRHYQEGAADRANKMLDNLVDLFVTEGFNKEDDERSVQLDDSFFNIVISAYARSGDVNGALGVLRKVQNWVVSIPGFPKASIETYNSILHACAKEDTKSRSEEYRSRILNVALSVLDEIQRSPDMEPDSFTYRQLFRVCKEHIVNDEERKHSIEDLFARCCEAGYLDKTVVDQLQADFLHQAFWMWFGPYKDDQTNEVDFTKIPKEWTRKVDVSKTRQKDWKQIPLFNRNMLKTLI